MDSGNQDHKRGAIIAPTLTQLHSSKNEVFPVSTQHVYMIYKMYKIPKLGIKNVWIRILQVCARVLLYCLLYYAIFTRCFIHRRC